MLAVEGPPNEEWHTVATLTGELELEVKKQEEYLNYIDEIARLKILKFTV
jgi:hypothetical protein